MKKRGYTLSSEKTGHFSYSFVFSKNKKWISLSCSKYDPNYLITVDEVQELPRLLETSCILTGDIFGVGFFECFGKTGEWEDRVHISSRHCMCVLGKMWSNDCEPENANPDFWEPLLVDGNTFGQLKEAWNQGRGGLHEVAALLDMDESQLECECPLWEKDVITLYFNQKIEEAQMKEGATELTFHSVRYSPISGETAHYEFETIRGISSKGLRVILSGDCFANDEVELSNAKIRRSKDPAKDFNQERVYEYFEAPWKKTELSDGKVGFVAEFDEYVHFPGFDIKHPYLKHNLVDISSHYCSTLIFTPTVISGKEHKLLIYVIPYANKEEGASWAELTLQG
jgi:hypothetical protein